jgi:hypothetical protein
VGFFGSFLISALAFVFFFAVAICFVVYGILGAVHAFRGEEFHYPSLAASHSRALRSPRRQALSAWSGLSTRGAW